MKRTVMVLVTVVAFWISGTAFAQDDIKDHPKCKYSGMDREQFAYSRMLVAYEDGTEVGTGSLRCTSLDLALNFAKTVKFVKIGDYTTKTLIDADKAYWVIGGDVKGVMTKNPKWAFAKKEDAQTFIKEHGGELATYETALRTTYNGMADDTNYLHDAMSSMKGHNHGQEAPQHNHGH
jgi:hypothetical protein